MGKDSFAYSGKVMKDAGWRLVAEWASDESRFNRGFCVFAAYCFSGEYLVIRTEIPPEEAHFQSLTRYFAAAFRFERQIKSLMGLIPAGHPDLRPWIAHEDWPSRRLPFEKGL